MSERDYYLAFSVASGIGPKKFFSLVKKFKSAEKAWNRASLSHFEELGLGSEKTFSKFNNFREKFSFSTYLRLLRNKKVSFITYSDSVYPKLLKETPKPPFVLFVKGDISKIDQDKAIAVVGTRKTTQYGRDVTKLITGELVANGFTIVSGLAMGIDATAHMAALENKGKTIAVLGCGVDCCTPSENQKIYNQIIEGNGAVVSELPLGHPPTKGSFPSRNRIIAGLSLGVLVTEGAEDSGSLITADYAFKFKRPVFAVPGPITSQMSKGPFKLISKGAKLITSASDILDEFKIQKSKVKIADQKSKISGETRDEIAILQILENEPLHFDEIVRISKIDSSRIGSVLSIMEIKGLIKSQDGGFFSIAS